MYIMKAPSRYYQGENQIESLYDCIPSNVSNILVVISVGGFHRYKNYLNKLNETYSVYVYYSDLSNFVDILDYDCVIGIGGGKVLDLAKYKSYVNNECYLILVPTVISNDAAYTSMIVPSSYQNKDTMIIRMNKNPDVIIVDTNIIKKAGKRYLISGICDASSKYLESYSCYSNNGITMSHGDNIPILSHNLSRTMAEVLNQDCLDYFINGNESVLDNIIYMCTYVSGMISDNCGLSLPHAFSLALDECTNSNKLHGEKVAFGVLVASYFVSGFIDYYSFYTDILGMEFNLIDYGITEDTIDAILDSVLSNKLIKNFSKIVLTRESLKKAILFVEKGKFIE